MLTKLNYMSHLNVNISPQLKCGSGWFVSQCWRKYDYTIIKGDRFGSRIQPISQL